MLSTSARHPQTFRGDGMQTSDHSSGPSKVCPPCSAGPMGHVGSKLCRTVRAAQRTAAAIGRPATNLPTTLPTSRHPPDAAAGLPTRGGDEAVMDQRALLWRDRVDEARGLETGPRSHLDSPARNSPCKIFQAVSFPAYRNLAAWTILPTLRLLGLWGFSVRRIALCVALAGLAGCTQSISAFSLNDQAKAAPVVKASFVRNGTSSGTVAIDLATGEHFEGLYSVNTNAVSMFGMAGSTFVSGTAISGNQQGLATLQGNRGTVMECQVAATFGRGSGLCHTDKGAEYRIYF